MEVQTQKRFNYRFSKNFDKGDITKSVAKYGIAVIEDYLTGKDLEQLKSESMELLNSKTDSRLEKNKSALQKVTINSVQSMITMETLLPTLQVKQ